MAKAKTETERQKKAPEVTEEPGAWERFERAVDHAMKAPPKYRTAEKPARQKGSG
jgi:hypothetical protein